MGAGERKPRVLDLFSGTGSVGRVFQEEGFEVVSVDINPKFKPTVIADILEWDYAVAFPPGYFDVVFACSACEQFSRARTT
jgi:site-specific DNA-cytosine methylase